MSATHRVEGIPTSRHAVLADAPVTAETAGPSSASSASNGGSDMRLRGAWAILGRVLWLAVTVLSLATLAAGLGAAFAQLRMPCTVPGCSVYQLNPQQANTLHTTLGLSLGAYATFVTTLMAASALFWVVGTGLFLWGKLDHVSVLLMALNMITQGVIGSSSLAPDGLTRFLMQAHSSWQIPAMLLNQLAQLMFFFAFAVFPNGRFVPRWLRWVSVVWAVLGAAYVAGYFAPSLMAALPPFGADMIVVCVLLVGVQIYRYRQVSSAVQRQQTKWIVAGFTLLIVTQVGLVLAEQLFAPLRQPGSLYVPIAALVIIPVYLLAASSLFLAIGRYRLWAVDIVINRALVYGSLTGLLALVYAGCVIGLESLTAALPGRADQQPVAIVISTLAIAALFQPLRRRLQVLIDRHFYRSRYDAHRTVTTFGATVRDEVDLAELRDELLAVVQQTMQPARVSLWLLHRARPASEQDVHLEREEDY